MIVKVIIMNEILFILEMGGYGIYVISSYILTFFLLLFVLFLSIFKRYKINLKINKKKNYRNKNDIKTFK